MKKDTFHGILAVIGGLLVHFTFGHFYTISNMVPYIMSYLRAYKQPDLNDRISVWLSAAALGMQGLAMPLGGVVADKIGVRPVVAISCIINSASILVTYFTVRHSFALVAITYALLVGFGFGFAYSVAMAAAVTWFPDRRGLIVGLIVGGFGLGALICTPIQTAFINPDNVKVDKLTRDFTDPELLARVPNVFLLMGGILLGIQIIGFILLRPKPTPKEGDNNYPDKSVKLEGTVKDDIENAKPGNSHSVPMMAKDLENEKGDSSSTAAEPHTNRELNLTPREMVKCLDFYLLWFIMLCHIIPITIITSAYKQFGQNYIDNDFFLSMVVTLSSIFNSGGRVVWGFIVDKLSFKIPLMSMLVFWAATLFTFPHLANLTGIGLKVTFIIWVCFLFFSLSGVFALMPAATGRLFGPVNLATNYGIVFTAFAAGSLLCATITTLVKSEHAYMAQFSGCGAVCLAALFATLWVEDRTMPAKFNCFNWFTSCGAGYRRPRIKEVDSRVEMS